MSTFGPWDPAPCDFTALIHRIDLPDVLEWIRGRMEATPRAQAGALGTDLQG